MNILDIPSQSATSSTWATPTYLQSSESENSTYNKELPELESPKSARPSDWFERVLEGEKDPGLIEARKRSKAMKIFNNRMAQLKSAYLTGNKPKGLRRFMDEIDSRLKPEIETASLQLFGEIQEAMAAEFNEKNRKYMRAKFAFLSWGWLHVPFPASRTEKDHRSDCRFADTYIRLLPDDYYRSMPFTYCRTRTALEAAVARKVYGEVKSRVRDLVNYHLSESGQQERVEFDMRIGYEKLASPLKFWAWVKPSRTAHFRCVKSWWRWNLATPPSPATWSGPEYGK